MKARSVYKYETVNSVNSLFSKLLTALSPYLQVLEVVCQRVNSFIEHLFEIREIRENRECTSALRSLTRLTRKGIWNETVDTVDKKAVMPTVSSFEGVNSSSTYC